MRAAAGPNYFIVAAHGRRSMLGSVRNNALTVRNEGHYAHVQTHRVGRRLRPVRHERHAARAGRRSGATRIHTDPALARRAGGRCARARVDDFDLPASFTVVSADDDNRRGAQVSELLDGIPGLVARDRQNYAQDTQLSIRGFGARSTFGVRGVRLLVDGIPASMPDGQGQLSHFNVLGAERVEVLRGPFSALYGNSSGGVLLWSADGAPNDPWRLRATYGSNATVDVGTQLLGQQGAVHYNLAANHFETDGVRDHSRAKRDSVNAKLGFDLAEGSRLDLVLNYLDAPDAQDPLGLTRAQFNADPAHATSVATQFNTRKSVRQSQAGAIFTQQFDNQALRLMAYDGQRSVEQFLAIPLAVQRNPLHSGGVIDLDSNYEGADARWAWQGEALGRPLQLTVGTNVDRQRQHRTGYENFVGDILGVKGALRRNQRDEVQNVDQFAQLWWQWSERWSALLGVRHSDVRFASDDHYTVGRNPDDSGQREYSATTPVAGIVFRADEDLRFTLRSDAASKRLPSTNWVTAAMVVPAWRWTWVRRQAATLRSAASGVRKAAQRWSLRCSAPTPTTNWRWPATRMGAAPTATSARRGARAQSSAGISRLAPPSSCSWPTPLSMPPCAMATSPVPAAVAPRPRYR